MTNTHLWDISGKKIPIQLMQDDHIRTSYRLCWIVVYYYQSRRRDNKTHDDEKIAQDLKIYWGIKIPFDTAEKFSTIFENEIKRRGKKFMRPQKALLFSYLKQRQDSLEYLFNTYKNIIYGKD